RDRAHALARSWTVLHRVDPQSPLYGHTPESLAGIEAELTLAVSGTDDTSLQTVHARWRYSHQAIAWGYRLADIVSETPDGDLLLDLKRFHELTPTTPTDSFPWPKPAGSAT